MRCITEDAGIETAADGKTGSSLNRLTTDSVIVMIKMKDIV